MWSLNTYNKHDLEKENLVKKRDITGWFGRAFGINKQIGSELQTNCPYCNHTSFFFSTTKRIGFCHRASCNKAPTLDDLIKLKGYGPNEYGVSDLPEKEGEQHQIDVPGRPLLFWKNKQLMTHDQEAIDYLQSRGLGTVEILRFSMTFDGSRVYIPVREEGRVVNYVGRDITGKLPKKYKYAPGQKTSWHIFGWEECKYWDELTLVENTFVSIWLRNKINCTTVFGSHLSNTQLNMIGKSDIKRVVVMWDEGAELKAEKAVKGLRSIGTDAIYIRTLGQPDDHPLEEILHNVERAKSAIGKQLFIRWEV